MSVMSDWLSAAQAAAHARSTGNPGINGQRSIGAEFLGRLGRASALVLIVSTARGVDAQAGGAAAEQAFMRRNATAPGVHVAPALQYVVKHSGPLTGAHPTRTSAARIRYEGRFIDGEIFDKGPETPFIFPIRAIAPGMQEALMMMRPGDQWEIFVPPELGYGWSGKPPAGRVLIFKLELLEWAEMPRQPPPMLSEMPKP